MLACTLLTSIAFANNDTLNKIANDNKAYYVTLKIKNNTRFYVHVETSFFITACKKTVHYLRAGETQSYKFPLSAASMCKVTKVEATFEVAGAASVTKITNYDPKIKEGTNEKDFIIEEIALDEQQTKFECRVVPVPRIQ
jgi:hypothetical protein